MKKRILSTLLALCLVLTLLPRTAWADDSGKCGEDITWSVTENNTKLTISGSGDMYIYNVGGLNDNLPWREYRSSISTVEIQAGVTGIASSAFQELDNLTTIQIPESVTSIGSYIFFYCTKLNSVDVPSSITIIPSGAFSQCKSLTNITLPDTITEIYSHAFSGCSALTSIQIPSSVKVIWNNVFSQCSSLEKIVIPDSVTTVGGSLFEDCTSLKECIFPRSVEEMGDDMFTGCTALKSVTLPENLKEIGFGFFQNCSSLSQVTVPATVTSVSPFAFFGCTNFKDIYYGGTIEQWKEINISDKETPSKLYLSNLTTVHCSDGEIILEKNEFNPHKHSYKAVVTRPTCTEQGYTTYKCECGNEYISEYVPATGHRFNRWQIIQEATETKPGLRVRTCTVCGHEESEEILWTDPGEHTHSYTSVVTPPTCTEKGYTTYTCECGDTYRDNETPAVGHSYGGWTVVREATETHTGLRERSCGVCGNTQSEIIPKLDPEPSEPSRPSKPSEKPSKPEKPTEKPVEPEIPAQPETPVQPEEPVAPAPVYDDVAPEAWYSEAATYVASKGLMTGTSEGNFSPNEQMTRAMVWTVLGRMAGADVDGSGSEWYAKAQAWAAASGVSDGTNPNGGVTRQELAVMLWRSAGSPEGTAEMGAFSDGGEVAEWANAAMRWAVDNGILNGDNGALKPGAPASRAEVAAMLMRFCEKMGL